MASSVTVGPCSEVSSHRIFRYCGCGIIGSGDPPEASGGRAPGYGGNRTYPGVDR
jgi:hypothetical protein